MRRYYSQAARARDMHQRCAEILAELKRLTKALPIHEMTVEYDEHQHLFFIEAWSYVRPNKVHHVTRHVPDYIFEDGGLQAMQHVRHEVGDYILDHLTEG